MHYRALLCIAILAGVVSYRSRAQHGPEAITDSSYTGIIIGSQYRALPGERTTLTMSQTDSSRGFALLDSVFSSPQTIICTQSWDEAQIHRRYPQALIIAFPEGTVGSIWTVRFTSGKFVMQEKVLLLR
jgi:hypothetical protein